MFGFLFEWPLKTGFTVPESRVLAQIRVVPLYFLHYGIDINSTWFYLTNSYQNKSQSVTNDLILLIKFYYECIDFAFLVIQSAILIQLYNS